MTWKAPHPDDTIATVTDPEGNERRMIWANARDMAANVPGWHIPVMPKFHEQRGVKIKKQEEIPGTPEHVASEVK